MGKKVYIGDAVYAEFNRVSVGDILLTTEDGYSVTNAIYLEPHVFENLLLVRNSRATRITTTPDNDEAQR